MLSVWTKDRRQSLNSQTWFLKRETYISNHRLDFFNTNLDTLLIISIEMVIIYLFAAYKNAGRCQGERDIDD